MHAGGERPPRFDEAPGATLRRRLADGPPVVLDGATGTELERRGLYTGLPLWSTHALIEAPDVVEAIHRDYVRAGADILTANTFRTQRRVLARSSHGAALAGDRDRALTVRAVELARTAADDAGRRVLVAGSAPTLEDCYRPDLVPDVTSLRAEHARHAENLATAKVDLILIETMNTIREAVAAAEAARATETPLMVSFVSWHDALLLSGEPLQAAVRALAPYEPLAVLVNCLPPSAVPRCIPVLRDGALPFGVYANLGAPDEESGFVRVEDCSPDDFGRLAREWVEAGARLVGGCCGTTPRHIRAIADSFNRG
jgi:S-methylmethionine-dependent homocysteine/selenocysteine methylase